MAERDVITKIVHPTGKDQDRFVFDFSLVQVGDTFLAKGPQRVRLAKQAIGRQGMKFDREQVGQFSMRFKRKS